MLAIVGAFVLRDALRTRRSGVVEQTSRLARWVQSVEIPGTMVRFRVANVRVSVLFVLPLGFATGLVDIRLAMLILLGSLFGVQLGAIGTTFVKPFMIKVVMGPR